MMKNVIPFWIALVLFTIFGLVGCNSGMEPPLSTTKPSATWTATPSPEASITSDLANSSLSSQTTTTPSPPLPSPLTPTPTVVTLPPTINPENAATLTQVAEFDLGPWDLVHALAWSPGGDRLGISAGEWLHLYPYQNPGEPVSIDLGVWSPGLAFSPDGRWIATGGRNGVIRLWEASSLTNVRTIEAHRKGINHLTFNQDGKLLASAGNDAMARLWIVPAGEEQIQMIGGTFAVPAVEFSLAEGALAILNGSVVRIRDIESGRFVQTLTGEGSYFSLAITQDDQLLASGGANNHIDIWELDSEAPIRRLTGHAGQVGRYSSLIWEVDFNPQGSILASAGGDGTARLWDPSTGSLLNTLQAHNKAVTSLAFSPDGRALATGGLDGVVRLWQVSP